MSGVNANFDAIHVELPRAVLATERIS